MTSEAQPGEKSRRKVQVSAAPADQEQTRLDRVEQIARIAKEALLALGLLVGGIWGYYRFVNLETKSAKIAYEKAAADAKSFGMQVSIETASLSEGKCTIYGTVKLQNMGSEIVTLSMRSWPPVELTSIRPQNTGHFVELASRKRYWIDDTDRAPRDNVDIVPGRTVSLPFVAQVDSPGLYLLRFAAPISFSKAPEGPRPNFWSERQIVRACAILKPPSQPN